MARPTTPTPPTPARSDGFQRLADELTRRYTTAPPGRRLTSLHLFAIEHADARRQVSKAALLERAALPASHVTEPTKALNPADHVTVTKPL